MSGELEEAAARREFRLMFYDIGLAESLKVLEHLILTAAILSEVLAEELDEVKKGKDLDTP
jgi:hypothetical protein